MTKCSKCGGRLIGSPLDVYRCDDQIGFPNVSVLNAAVEYRCGECGISLGVHIPDVEGLEAAVAVARIREPMKLVGAEFRFLRRACGLHAKDVASYIEVTAGTVSHWENDKEPIGPQSDKLMRLVVGYMLADKAPGVPFDKRAVATMQVRHLVDVGSAPRMISFVFQRTKVRLADHRHETEWELEDKAA